MAMRVSGLALAVALLVLQPEQAQAATGLNGAAMQWPFALPFAGLLLSIARGPLLFRRFWHHHYGKVAAAWTALAPLSILWFAGATAMLASFVHAMLDEYLSFILLLFALYTVAGGIFGNERHEGYALDQYRSSRVRNRNREPYRHHGGR